MREVNVLALALGSRAAVRAMRVCGAEGHIVNVSSSASRLEAPGFYGATKAAVNAITATLRQEVENDTNPRGHRDPLPDGEGPHRHNQPDLLRGLAASRGEEIGPPSGGLFPPEALDRAAAASRPGPGRCRRRSTCGAVRDHPAHRAEHLRDHRKPARRLTVPA